MRIAVGQLWQETNTFNPWPTFREHFEDSGVLRGADLVEQMAETNELGGFIQSLRAWPEHPEILGLVRLPAWPGGPVAPDTFPWLRDELVEALRRQMPVRGVLLALHGSLAADGAPDVEGEILEALRQVLGPHVPLVATLDLHANVTAKMVRHADALVLYHTIPHVDILESGRRAAAVLRRILIDGARPVTAFQKIPLVVPAERANTEDPASVSHEMKRRLQDLEARPEILSAGLATVQPWLDIPELGNAVVVVADGDANLARTQCAALAAAHWQRRQDYVPELVPVADAVRLAWENPDGLVVLSDGADATTSGAPGDNNRILGELLKYDWPRPALVTLVAPQVVEEATRRGIGAELVTPLGGVRDYRNCRPLPVTTRVAGLFRARFRLSGHLGNLTIDMGPAAVLRHGNVHVVVTARSGPHFAPELFQAAGLDPFTAVALVAKSPCGFRAAYQGRAIKIMLVGGPGCAPADFWQYTYRRIPRPVWPWEEIDGWAPNPQVVVRGGGA
jgi:microcystin degradation protein MlrC